MRSLRHEGAPRSPGIAVMSRRFGSKRVPDASAAEAALEVMDAEELRGTIRELIPWLDRAVQARLVDTLVEKAARSSADSAGLAFQNGCGEARNSREVGIEGQKVTAAVERRRDQVRTCAPASSDSFRLECPGRPSLTTDRRSYWASSGQGAVLRQAVMFASRGVAEYLARSPPTGPELSAT